MSPLKSLAAVALSLWLGALACLMGCAQPVLASLTPTHRQQVFECKTSANADDGSCCHRGKSTSDKNQATHSLSCCPLDATLSQKQDPTPISHAELSGTPLLTVIDSPFQHSANGTASPLTVFHAGRDILQQIHILRI